MKVCMKKEKFHKMFGLGVQGFCFFFLSLSSCLSSFCSLTSSTSFWSIILHPSLFWVSQTQWIPQESSLQFPAAMSSSNQRDGWLRTSLVFIDMCICAEWTSHLSPFWHHQRGWGPGMEFGLELGLKGVEWGGGSLWWVFGCVGYEKVRVGIGGHFEVVAEGEILVRWFSTWHILSSSCWIRSQRHT